ncbi:hypothetical protein RI054_12g61140 [Pseudoscourfieldia marina]
MAPTSDARPANAWTNGDRQTLPRVTSSRPAARPGGIVPTRRAATPSLTQAPAATESRNLRSAPAADQGLPPSGRTSHTAGTSGGEYAVPPTRWAGWATDSQLPQQGESDERYARLVARERAVAAREAGALRMTSQAQVMHNRDVARLHRELAESREATRVQATEVVRLEELVTSLQMEAAAAARERKAALQSQATSPASMAQLERLQLAMRKQQAEYETKVATLQEELERTSLALARTRAEADELGAALASERRRHATHVESTHAFQQRLRGEMDDIATMSASLAANSESHMRGVVDEARQTTADAISDVRAAREHTAGTVSDMRGDVERWSDNFAERMTARREARRREAQEKRREAAAAAAAAVPVSTTSSVSHDDRVRGVVEDHADHSRSAAEYAARVAAETAARSADLRARLALSLSPTAERAANAMAAKGRALSEAEKAESEMRTRAHRLARVLDDLKRGEEGGSATTVSGESRKHNARKEADRLRGALIAARRKIVDVSSRARKGLADARRMQQKHHHVQQQY